jgi:hypothetical protein
MYDLEYQANQVNETIPADIVIERRNGTERRKKPACGFIYISTVGWICRREQIRRKDDPEIYTNNQP